MKNSTKKQLIGAVIAILVACAVAGINKCSEKEPTDSPKQKIATETKAISTDSSTQNIVRQGQLNANKGDVFNAPVTYNRPTFNIPPETKTEISKPKKQKTNEEEPSVKIGSIDNSNVAINPSGPVTQNIINPKKKLAEIEKIEILGNIKQVYTNNGRSGETCVILVPNSNFPKSDELCEDLEVFLEEKGFEVTINRAIIGDIEPPVKVSYTLYTDCISLFVSDK